jgi:PilZ domain
MPHDAVDAVPARDLSAPDPACYGRRAAFRYLCNQTNPARVSNAGVVWRLAWIHNLSSTGVGLILGESVDPGTELVIELLTPGGARGAVHGRVVHATHRPDKNWLVGCTFAQPLSRDELEALL